MPLSLRPSWGARGQAGWAAFPTGSCGLPSGVGFGVAPWYLWAMSRNSAEPASLKPAAPLLRRRAGAGGRAHRARLTATAFATVMCLASGAAAADGYYFRGGIGMDRPGDTAFTDTDCASEVPAALYGCGTGGDGAPHRSTGQFGTVPAVELGLGHAAGSMRFEVLVEYRPDFDFDGQANFLAPGRRQEVSASLSSVSGMLAGFVDLHAFGLPAAGPVVPFVGGGVGLARTRIGATTMTFPKTSTTVPGGSRTGPAWMVTAGVAVALDARISLDLAWRYSDLGDIRTPRGPGRVVWRDGSREPLPLDLAPTQARLRGHGLRLSLRYAF